MNRLSSRLDTVSGCLPDTSNEGCFLSIRVILLTFKDSGVVPVNNISLYIFEMISIANGDACFNMALDIPSMPRALSSLSLETRSVTNLMDIRVHMMCSNSVGVLSVFIHSCHPPASLSYLFLLAVRFVK